MNKIGLIGKTLTLFCVLFFHGINMGQNNRPSTKIKVFRPNDSQPTNSSDSTIVSKFSKENVFVPKVYKHNVKWNYSLLFRGVFLMNYEFLLKKKITGEVGLGLTYRDLVFEISKNQNNGYNFGAAIEPIYKPCGEAGFRFYPTGFDNFEGFYLSPMFSYRNYVFSTNKNTSSYSSLPYINTINNFNPGYRFLDLQVKLGYQYESIFGWGDFLADFYVGFASRNATINAYEAVQVTNWSGTQIQYVSTSYKKQYLQALIGWKICYIF